MLSGSTPALKRFTYRSTRTRVFPVPADASRTTLRVGSMARRRESASEVTDVILPTDGRVGARFAPVHIIGLGREVATPDPIHHRPDPLLGGAEHPKAFVLRGKKRDDPSRTLKGEVRCFAE